MSTYATGKGGGASRVIRSHGSGLGDREEKKKGEKEDEKRTVSCTASPSVDASRMGMSCVFRDGGGGGGGSQDYCGAPRG